MKIAPRDPGLAAASMTWILAPRFWTSAEVEAANTWTETFIERFQKVFGPARWVPLEDHEAVERFRNTPLAGGTRSLWITGGEPSIRDWFEKTHSGNNVPILFDLGVLVKQPEAPALEPYCRSLVSTSGFHETQQEALIEWIHQVLGWR